MFQAESTRPVHVVPQAFEGRRVRSRGEVREELGPMSYSAVVTNQEAFVARL
jgi:hypothetical protein